MTKTLSWERSFQGACRDNHMKRTMPRSQGHIGGDQCAVGSQGSHRGNPSQQGGPWKSPRHGAEAKSHSPRTPKVVVSSAGEGDEPKQDFRRTAEQNCREGRQHLDTPMQALHQEAQDKGG